eukprot:CAMPEP_0174893534 /NCGR_PEP_ID=MMETSP0167-20121228/8359_1 /TAXON_ID=38298 /ORGANISM="Rhodella maculata, Strain CCMP736" /LENGTH=319 /DNA_ID=CAMNT_0016132365 /DNA_START=39 /DNA_END=999 /DNA_ORIENTATION=+
MSFPWDSNSPSGSSGLNYNSQPLVSTKASPYPTPYASGAPAAPATSAASFSTAPRPPARKLKLYDSHRERTDLSTMADLFALIKATEALEAAWRRGTVPDDVYTKECWSLINQFRATKDSLVSVVPDPLRFMEEYNMSAPSARRRLFEVGIPATVEHGSGGGGVVGEKKERESKMIAQAVAGFITAMDSLRLNMNAVDQIQPLVTDILTTLNKLDVVRPDFEGKVKLKTWLATLNQMRASDVLSDDQVRQLLMDLDNSYNAFHNMLDDDGPERRTSPEAKANFNSKREARRDSGFDPRIKPLTRSPQPNSVLLTHLFPI